MNDEKHRVAADLLRAYDTKVPIEPPRNTIAGLDLEGAYAIQQWQEKALKDAGRSIIGRKIGLTSVAMQQQLGVDSPDFGFFSDQQLYRDGDHIDVSRFIAPKVEPELAFIINRDLGADTTFDDVVEAVDEVYLAVEIIDSRVRDWDIRLVDTVADNASCAAVILSSQPIDVAVDQLPEVEAVMTVGDGEPHVGTGAAVMGHPLTPLVWLAGVLAEQGTPLKAGEIILTGSFCGAAAVRAGENVYVDYGTYGTLTATFSKGHK
ncbi:2-keto-4-pentenoate hydratase [Corynebacterium ciconiae DSM 44920]|uniref:2-keto-4-pentenoate hydratase n=1 Tax=Corynebacterium ciconiae TaxID=227319 RepID=UPI0003758929|nr:fumarylacetoacetate hydrolase family protein [Corynebacterium ciconiae]WKD61587.1 2-keto-4-pentenoate hydratase [Corynebacterium ciconiae DSM 44920]